MKKVNRFQVLIILVVFILSSAAEAQIPQINSISVNTLTRSGRLKIFGTGFGSSGGTSQVLIDGHSAIITRWSSSEITAYVPESAGPGPVAVQVVSSSGVSNTYPLTVTLRQSNGRVHWTFEADVANLWWRPALAADGTIYVHGSDGFVFALSPDGGLLWATKVNWYAYVPPAVGPDGTIYVGSIQRITALNPDGTERWQFTDPGAQGVQSGPAIGPDSNIYFANDFGLGAYSFSQGGQLRWNNPGSPQLTWYGGIGGETVLGPRTVGGAIEQMYVIPEPLLETWTLQAFSLADGSLRFSVPIEGQHDLFGQQQTQPAVGHNGTIYVTHMRALGGIGWVLEAYSPVDGHSLWYYRDNGPNNGMTPPAVGPDGVVYYSASTSRIIAFNPSTLLPNWQYQDGTIMYHPTVSPLNDMVVTGGVVTFGDVGFIKAISTGSGQLLWTVPLPGAFYPEPRVFPVHHPRFTPDGNTVYVSTTILVGSTTDPHSFLYSIATGSDSSFSVLHIKALIQGFYDPVLNKMLKDSVRIYLRNASSPHSIVDSSLSILDSIGMGNFTFANAVNSVPYYIVVKHRNGLETWSADGNAFISGSLSYDFTVAALQAFGNNQIQEGSKYCIYNGDINQDDVIDITDIVSVFNDASNFVSGYVVTDVTGDLLVDLSDLTIVFNNSANFVHLIRP